jgi:hypothetical protein
MVTEEDKETRRLLSSFYSAELNSHARLIIGAAALFFTIMSVILEVSKGNNLEQVQILIAFLSLWFVSSILWFLVMRYLAYGILANAATVALIGISKGKYEDIHDAIRERALEDRILMVLPSVLFISTAERKTKNENKNDTETWKRKYGMFFGILLCLFLGIVTTWILLVFIGLDPLTLLEFYRYL